MSAVGGKRPRWPLYPAAAQDIREVFGSVATYSRQWWADGKWHGDICGCPDDRCIGYHHDEHEQCGCLEVLLTQGPTTEPTQ